MALLKNKYDNFHKIKKGENIDNNLIFEYLKEFVEEIRSTNSHPTFMFNTYCINPFQQVFSNLIPSETLVGYHNHDYFEINYISSGTVYEIIGDNTITLQSGSLLFMHPTTAHTLYAPPNTVGLNILLSPSYIGQIEKEFKDISSSNYITRLFTKGGYAIFHSEKGGIIENDIQNIVSEIRENYSRYSFNALLLENSAKRLLLQLAIHNKEIEIFTPGSGKRESSTAADIIDYIKTHYANTSADKVAAHFNYSRRQLLRILQKNTGSSYWIFVSQLRFTNAAYLLARTNTPIDEISKRVGLETTYFYKFFKKQTGMSPLQYRKRYRNEKTKIS